MPGALLGQGSGALFWRASDLANLTREALGHHLEACFTARFPQEKTGRGGPTAQEFITRTTQELEDARAMRGGRRSRGATPHPGEDAGLRVCIDVPGLNGAASQEPFWPTRMGHCEGPPHNHVCMPFGLPSVASAYQRLMRSILEAQEVRHCAFLAEMETDLEEPPGPPEPPEAQGSAGS